MFHTDVDAPAQKGAGGQHHGRRREPQAGAGDHAADLAALDDQVIDLLLKQVEVGLLFERGPDEGAVQGAVGLGTGGAHGGAFGCVQGAELDARVVGGAGHQAAERVDLLDQMPLADAADGRVAAHLTQGVDVLRHQQGAQTHAGRGQRRLGARVAAADDDDVVAMGLFQQGGVGRHGRGQKGILPVRISHHMRMSPL